MKVDGYQQTAVQNGTYNVRFVGVISDIPEGTQSVGFKIEANDFGKLWNLNDTTVYRSITASFGTETVTAEERGGKYITAAAITEIPTDEGEITFKVTPYITIGGLKVYGETITVTVSPAQ